MVVLGVVNMCHLLLRNNDIFNSFLSRIMKAVFLLVLLSIFASSMVEGHRRYNGRYGLRRLVNLYRPRYRTYYGGYHGGYGNMYRLSSFQAGGTKVERFLPEDQHTQRKFLNLENWVNGAVSKIGHHFRK